MGITGNLKTMALAELLQWLSQGQKTGTLVFDSDKFEKHIVFERGTIISSASTDPAEYLGNFLTARAMVTDEQVDEALARQETEGKLLGSLLIEIGAITEEQLQEVLLLKAEESIYDIFTWEKGDFRFLDGEVPEETMVPMALDVQWIVLEGSRRVDELARLREHIPSPLCVPVAMVDLESLEVEDTEARILSWVDDDRSVEDICRDAQTTLILVTQVLAEQVQAGNIKAIRPRVIEVKVPTADAEAPVAPVPQHQPPPQQQVTVAQPIFAPMPAGYPQQQYMQMAPPPAAPPPGQALDGLRNHPSFGGMAGSNPASAADGGGQAGASMPQPAPTPPPSPALPPEVAGIIAESDRALASGELDTALNALREAKATKGSDAGVASAVEDGERKLQKALSDSGIALTSVPRLSCDMTSLTQLKISPSEGFMLTRVNGSYDIKSLLKMHPAPVLDTQLLFWKLKKSGHVAF